MSKFKDFFKLSTNQKILITKSLILIIIIRLSLSLLSFSNVKKLSKKFSRPNKNNKNYITVEDIVWSVKVASNYVPRATCLTQAITAQIILSRHNYLSNLKIGVIKSEEFEAHAWLEIDNEIVLGESEKNFVPILNFEP